MTTRPATTFSPLPYTLVLLALYGLAEAVDVSNKVGLAWGGSPDQVSQFLQTGRVSWYYHWSETPDIDQNIDFAPMLWGERDVEGWQETIGDTLDTTNVSTLLGMNEPNLPAQSNLTAQEAADLWKQHIQPYKARGLRLASPVPTNAPSGPIWLQDFLNACGSECTVDVIALHYYGTNASALIDYVNHVHDMFQRPIWLTEFACQSFVDENDVASAEEISLFMNTTVSFLESTDWVERYSWFGAMTKLHGMNPLNALMNEDGHINTLGLQYIGAGSFVVPSTDDDAGNNTTGTALGQNGGATPTFVPDPNATGVSGDSWPSIGGGATSLAVPSWLWILIAAFGFAL
ncbi:hypothetical protein EXIGLDRAFT_831991 [Exidia glandulosa HHB12029]|uniref:Asl1-like glycosyl hydrolase catalytic domain-containing protein n=1 Tax=Exidia glandulosa HHB12029 TaxID=1314781 RepID=A0A165M521_EXIGL|nr:hypothetical protein EXIGLDRAFT_831991 [Exidia glandulosa HHB12029]